MTSSSNNIEALYEHFVDAPHITIDSRRIPEGAIFFALPGERSDGNDYALQALSNGASWAVVDRPEVAAQSERCFLVDNTLAALQQLAALHRQKLGLPILSLTGSNGKTTTKELITAVLSRKFRTSATEGNLNNHIGVPLTLLKMDSSTEFGVVEMGASSCGEIALLASIAAPNYGLVTNIGRAHLGGFGGVEGIRRGKGELFDALCATGGTAFLRAGDEVLRQMAAERKGLKTVEYCSSAGEGIETHLVGDYNRFNIAAAVAVGRYFGVAQNDIAAAVAGYVPSNNRSQSMQSAHNLLTVDCYNANPSSMEAAIDNFYSTLHPEYHHRTLVLGDMLELGEWSNAEHQRMVDKAVGGCADRIILVGKEFGATKSADSRMEHYNSTEELIAVLAQNPVEGSFVLVKGSRGIGLERIIPLL
ncbi:MAG: UDP-N-acetylmuramoyl-tripeptide--D-alanyl-D-alanine ligase [Tidjanibacter sp.]|nr:UDP-N-acetylmuramoyl-tripeptide--D-alanyl-D-alanine ligase [Tidjanibacter sp.]